MRPSWSGCRAKPISAQRKARRETTPCPAAANLHGRCWPRYAISPHPAQAGAGYCRPHQSQPRTGQPALAKCTICPTCPPVPSRPALPCSRMRRRPSSRSVRVAPAQDLVRFYPCSRRRFPLTNSLQPCGCGGPRRDALQLYAQEFLHRLALARSARREFVANFLWYTPDRYLYRHGRIMPSAMAFYNSHYASGTVLPTACQPRVGRCGRPESPEQARRRGLVDIALCRVLSDAGLRRGEAAALKWGDVARWEDGSDRLRVGRSTARTGCAWAARRPTPRRAPST